MGERAEVTHRWHRAQPVERDGGQTAALGEDELVVERRAAVRKAASRWTWTVGGTSPVLLGADGRGAGRAVVRRPRRDAVHGVLRRR